MKRPTRPYLVFAGTQSWLVDASNKQDAINRFMDQWYRAHGMVGRDDWDTSTMVKEREHRARSLMRIARSEVRARRLRLSDEGWVLASFDKTTNKRLRKRYTEAFDMLRDLADRRSSKGRAA